ncbi:hypothetical protein CES86_5287 [Brucella lupini]|uniref:Uncharacterized protein n=1 Tax=Brucella lupini TaxID=255457 RepID=A0A256H0U5_9HYPH|nr:hypothetical protein CES86_5287 [Brucella lupini]
MVDLETLVDFGSIETFRLVSIEKRGSGSNNEGIPNGLTVRANK